MAAEQRRPVPEAVAGKEPRAAVPEAVIEEEPRTGEALPDDAVAMPEGVTEEQPRAGEALPDEEVTVPEAQAEKEPGIDEALPEEDAAVRQALTGKEAVPMEALVEPMAMEALVEAAAVEALVAAAEFAMDPVALGADRHECVRHRPIEQVSRLENRKGAGLARTGNPGDAKHEPEQQDPAGHRCPPRSASVRRAPCGPVRLRRALGGFLEKLGRWNPRASHDAVDSGRRPQIRPSAAARIRNIGRSNHWL
jgi:hypothetical protein